MTGPSAAPLGPDARTRDLRPLGGFDNADLHDAVRALRRASVLVVGDAMLDRYVYGRVHRISPEAPVPC
jgi:D-beta-D-heptose 7-phosphate kinase/D-beta-D-heptose 1-phosphate adenosyltransferase